MSKAANYEMVTNSPVTEVLCLPFLLYGSEAVGLSANNKHMLDNCINRAMSKIFGIWDHDSVW